MTLPDPSGRWHSCLWWLLSDRTLHFPGRSLWDAGGHHLVKLLHSAGVRAVTGARGGGLQHAVTHNFVSVSQNNLQTPRLESQPVKAQTIVLYHHLGSLCEAVLCILNQRKLPGRGRLCCFRPPSTLKFAVASKKNKTPLKARQMSSFVIYRLKTQLFEPGWWIAIGVQGMVQTEMEVSFGGGG